MSRMDEVLHSVKYVVDNEGRRTAVLLDLSVWQQVLHLLEALDEDENLGRLMTEGADDDKLEGKDAFQAYQGYKANLDL